jgi:hypothetical protein
MLCHVCNLLAANPLLSHLLLLPLGYLLAHHATSTHPQITYSWPPHLPRNSHQTKCFLTHSLARSYIHLPTLTHSLIESLPVADAPPTHAGLGDARPVGSTRGGRPAELTLEHHVAGGSQGLQGSGDVSTESSYYQQEYYQQPCAEELWLHS